MTRTLTVKSGDSGPTQTVRLDGRDGPANLTGATVVMQVSGMETSVPCEIVDAEAGTVRPQRDGLPVLSGDRMVVNVEFEVTFSDQSVQTFPEKSYLNLEVWSDLDTG